MKCNICKKEIATIHLTEIINNKIKEIHVCEKCAKEKGIETEKIKSSLNMADLFTSLIPDKINNKGEEEVPSYEKLKCQFCNMTFLEFRSRGKFGCAKCYETFREHIAPLLKRLQGSIQHTGKVPLNISSKTKDKYLEIKELKEKLMEAVKNEAYEEAARLRDKIKILTSGEVEENEYN
ncbi:MAG TPA: UvrB/UvrC motif-containing protein [bacterium]|nr:UvrB/UvrC motif-containing protein [bacterium]HOL47989.1 UvrB/UvrC motif-containing protein [bacterium]HPQ18587.1 UvrB/UvrC motif-containing protein [bacterium]